MYTDRHQQLSESLLGVNPMPWINRFRFIEARVTRVSSQGRLQISFQETGTMNQRKRDRFIKRFIAPMMTHDIARQLLVHVNRSTHAVSIAWSPEFGFSGTIALDRRPAVGGNGSAAIIFIDETSPDWANLKTISENPDVGLYHELLHARHIQRGTVVNDEREMEYRVIGIGRYTNAEGTENHYRRERNLPLRCCWDRETLQGIDFGYHNPSISDDQFGGSLAGLTPTGQFTEAEREMVSAAAREVKRDVNQLTDRVFFAHYPDRQGRLIDPKQEPGLAEEWRIIKARLVLPIIAAIDLREMGNQALNAGQINRAIGLYDRARRLSISPAEDRARATLNLGLASRMLKRYAAAIGYFEIVHTFPGISDKLKAKAEKNIAKAKQEYHETVP
jgi:hypothetical protein